MSKRGQTQEIFVWLTVLIVAAAILFFGVKLLKNTNKLKDDVLIVKFFNDVDKKLSQYYFLDKGSLGEEKFLLPNNIEWVCFADNTKNFDKIKEAFISESDFNLMKDLKQYSNVFVGPLSLYERNRFNLTTKIMVTGNPKCFAVNNEFTVSFENLGVRKGVKIAGI